MFGDYTESDDNKISSINEVEHAEAHAKQEIDKEILHFKRQIEDVRAKSIEASERQINEAKKRAAIQIEKAQKEANFASEKSASDAKKRAEGIKKTRPNRNAEEEIIKSFVKRILE